MKIFIPANKYLSVSKTLERAKRIRLITLVNGSIIDDTILPIDNELTDIKEFEIERLGYNELDIKLSDEPIDQIAVIQNSSENVTGSCDEVYYKVLHTRDLNIINTINSLAKNFKLTESDYCCCP